MASVLEQLGRQIFRCPTYFSGRVFESLISVQLFWQNLREAEIGQFEIAIEIDQNVFWFEVSVKNIIRMQVVEREENVGSIELGSLLLKSANLLQVEEELASGTVVESHEQAFIVLEAVVHLDHVWMLNLL